MNASVSATVSAAACTGSENSISAYEANGDAIDASSTAAMVSTSPPPSRLREHSRGRGSHADGEPGHEEEERLRTAGTEARFDGRTRRSRRAVQQAHGHAESRDGVVVFGTFEGEVASAGLTDLAGLDDRDRRANHLTAIGDKADVTIVADEREEQEHREDGSGQAQS